MHDVYVFHVVCKYIHENTQKQVCICVGRLMDGEREQSQG